MFKYVIERELPGAGGLTPADLHAIARKSLDVLRTLGTDIQWVHSYVAHDKIYCVYLATGEELVREHARLGGFPADRIARVTALMDPASCAGPPLPIL